MAEIGTPVWTTGHFQRVSAQDDLGLESVGAGLLRRLLPGIVQTTPNAGYYSFYPYLLWRWQEDSGSLERREFKQFYRRQEAAYALACLLHEHYGPMVGINGSNAASDALREQRDVIDVANLAEGYMESPYGGYGLFYARVLADIRLTQLGAGRYVDRVTETGAATAAAFAETFEQTRYFNAYFNDDLVPRDVLAELGEAVCLCKIPGRSDHRLLLDVFFGDPLDDPGWEQRRRTRVESLALFLEFHRQRPPDDPASLTMFRRALAAREFADGSVFASSFPAQQSAWRLYQLRECQTLALTTIWCAYLRRLEQRDPIARSILESELAAEADLAGVGLDPQTSVAEAITSAAAELGDGAAIVDAVQTAANAVGDEPARAIARSFQALLALVAASRNDEDGFAELVDEGGPGRWSLAFGRGWFDRHSTSTSAAVLRQLVTELHDQHLRVAVTKLSSTDYRDPFCIAEDDGLLRLVRLDDPFWTGARFGIVNHLLWTLGLLDTLDEATRLTPLGEQLLDEVNAGA